MEKINKTDIADILFEKSDFTRKESEDAVDIIFDTLKKELLKGKEINISNFGRFIPLVKQERVGTNPNTHEQITIPEKRNVVFHCAKTFKASLNKKNRVV